MAHSSRTCPECGARVQANASSCDLCGSDVEDVQPAAVPATGPKGSFCNDCGWKNPAGARFCSQCGSRLQEGVSSAEATDSRALPSARGGEQDRADAGASASTGVGKQVALLVGGGVLIIVALYMVTLVSKQNVGAGGAEASAAPAATSVLEEQELAPLEVETEEEAQRLRQQIASSSGDERRAAQTALVDHLFEAGRPDHAAVEAQHLAEETGDAQDWRNAGDLYFQWMESAEADYRADIARLAVAAYDNVLQQNPQNHDVRANLAWALQYDSGNPMRAIEETNFILEREPDHVQANFNRGYFLMRINRFDQAVEQLERVRELAASESPIAGQAEALIQIIRDERARMQSAQ